LEQASISYLPLNEAISESILQTIVPMCFIHLIQLLRVLLLENEFLLTFTIGFIDLKFYGGIKSVKKHFRVF
jgi:hypothetical protein